jgi:hypothetical protein
MSSNPEEVYIPVIKTPATVAANTIEMIKAEATGFQLGLKSRFGRLNVANGKYFRFRQVYFIAGLSGHGKSTLLNHTIQDFTNVHLNYGKCVYDYIICHHCFEMPPENEELRKVSSRLKVSYNYLLSSEYDYEKNVYNTLDDAYIKKVESLLEQDFDKPIYYFDEPCELSKIILNINAAIDHYKQKLFNNPERLEEVYQRYERYFGRQIKRPDTWEEVMKPKVVCTMDHTLLLEQAKDENTILETMRNLGKTAIFLKKRGCMCIFIGQFNNNIERVDRIKNPELHYPVKSDFYAQGEIFNACDGVYSIHQPELLGILLYGKKAMPTHLLVHIQIIKNRFGNVGSIWLKNDLGHGQLVNYPQNSDGTLITDKEV